MKSTNICKHISMKYFALHKRIKEKIVFVEYIGIELMIVDPLTEGLTPKIFIDHMDNIELISSFYD